MGKGEGTKIHTYIAFIQTQAYTHMYIQHKCKGKARASNSE